MMMTTSMPRGKTLGQGLVEFALVAPIFLLLVFGLIEGARMVYAFNSVNHAAQEAGRLAVLQNTANVAAVQERAIDAADPLTIGSSDVTVEVNSGSTAFGDREIGDRLAVSITYDFVPVVAFVFGSNASIELTGNTELMVE